MPTADGLVTGDPPRQVGAPAEVPTGTLADLFLDSLERNRRSDAMVRREPDGSWESFSSEEIAERVRELALGLRRLGYSRGERIGILAHTRLEWALTDYAIVMAGLVGVPVYPVLPSDQIAHVLADSGASALFLADQEALDKIVEVGDSLPELARVISFEPVRLVTPDLDLLTLDELAEVGRSAGSELADSYESWGRATDPEDVATLIYTSGTTGPPKGVMLSHANVYGNVSLAGRLFPISSEDRALALLPLAHIFERVIGHYIMWHLGVTIAYAESPTTVARDLAEVKPTVMVAVPRVYEKVLERVQSVARASGGLTWKIFGWARRVGERRAGEELAGRPVDPWLRLRSAVADRLVFQKLRERTGGRIRYFISGGAPLNRAVAKFFFGAGLPIIEGYGLTETSPILCFNPPDAIRLGTVGPPIPGTEIRIADDGEILARGPQIMKGYFRDETATREAIKPDGWFHTGDIGTLDEAGYLIITDRKKQLIITAYGKNIAPQPIEEEIKRSPLVTQAVILGDRRKFPIVLIVPDFDELRAWARTRGVSAMEPEALIADRRVAEMLEEGVLERCAQFAHYERPKRVLLLADEFSIESGELTLTLKVKRRVITERYAEKIDELYRRAEAEEVF